MFTFAQTLVTAQCTMSQVMCARRFADHVQPTNAVVLCIDDDEFVLEVTQAILQKHGYSVLIASNGRQALEVFREAAVDLVLVDYEMPGMKGHEVALGVKEFSPNVPVVLHSGSANVPEIAIQLTDAFISKGSETCVLLSTIADLIMKSRVSAKSRVRADRNRTDSARSSSLR
jgi:CheY-like chemotaxis protein